MREKMKNLIVGVALASAVGCSATPKILDTVPNLVEEESFVQYLSESDSEELFLELEELKKKNPASEEVQARFRSLPRGLSTGSTGRDITSNFYFTSNDDICSLSVVDTKHLNKGKEVKNSENFNLREYLSKNREVKGSEYRIDLKMRCDTDDKTFRGDSLRAFVNVPSGENTSLSMDFPTEYWESGHTGNCVRRIPEDVSEEFKEGLYKIVVDGMLNHLNDLKPVGNSTNFAVAKEGKVFDDICRKVEAYSGPK
jgi:hypothetical protein